jgi:enoyl-CoA hydratase/carnithine racemase
MAGDITVTRGQHAATVTINNASKRNAMSQAMWIRMGDVIQELSGDRQLRCIVLRGEGGKAFGSGADIDEFEQIRASKEQAIAFARHGHRAMHAVRDCTVPTLAAIQGACVGGGLELAAFCDMRICSEDSRFGIPIARLGATLAYAELEGLVRLAGHNVALELLLEGRVLDAQEAQRKGLVNRVVANADFEQEVAATVARICAGAPLSAKWHKKFVERLRQDAPLGEGDIAEGYACFDTEDYRIGYQAFLNKETPQFKGK